MKPIEKIIVLTYIIEGIEFEFTISKTERKLYSIRCEEEAQEWDNDIWFNNLLYELADAKHEFFICKYATEEMYKKFRKVLKKIYKKYEIK